MTVYERYETLKNKVINRRDEFSRLMEFVEKDVPLHVNPKNVRGEDYSSELALLKGATEGAKSYSNEIVQVIASLVKKEQHMFVFASDSTLQTDYRCNTRLGCNAIASNGKDMQPSSSSFGRNQGMDMFEGFDPVQFGCEVAKNAVEMLHAEYMKVNTLKIPPFTIKIERQINIDSFFHTQVFLSLF